jgi:3-methyl-2-oxobutanoate hydroxymethyltransferase
VSKIISQKLQIPAIGIGAGDGCDGQILVTDDLLGKYTDFKPRFVRRYANLDEVCSDAIKNYATDVMTSKFPSATESFFLSEAEEKLFQDKLKAASKT